MIENTVTSFSCKRVSPAEKIAIGNIGTGNIPILATFDMFDCRAMPNPHWDESLRAKEFCIEKWYKMSMHWREEP